MAHLRIVYDNAASRAAITASTEAGGLVVENLLTNVKTEVWRTTATTATLTLTWSSPEYISCVALPFTNLSSVATMGAELYTNTTDTSPVYEYAATEILADLIDNIEWGTNDIGVNAFAYGGGAYAVIWFAPVPVKKIVITIDDTTNTAGYIEAANLIVGNYWSPSSGAEYGCSVTNSESSTHERSDAGDLYTDRGCMYRSLSFDLTYMSSQSKTRMWQILRNNGMHKPLFVSLTPEADEPTDEQVYQVYGKLAKSASIKFKFLDQFDTSLDVEEL